MDSHIWWLILKLTLLALTATASDDLPSCQLWASDDGKWSVGARAQVACGCEGSDVRDLSLHLHGSALPTEIVNNTVRYSVPSATETVQNTYECWWRNYPLKSVTVTVLARLNVTDLACRFDVRDKLNCSFTRADGGEFRGKTRYQLGVASGGTSQCSPEQDNAAQMHCLLETTDYAYDFPTQTFTLTMFSDRVGEAHTQEIVLKRESLYVPHWPSSRPSQKTVTNNRTCLSWPNAKDLLELGTNLEWAVELRPRLPGIPPVNLTLPGAEKTDQNTLTFCFPHPPQGAQVFDVRLRCHIRGENTIWSEYHPEFDITTNATVPARPPQFMPDGFAFDKDKNELTVNWFPLAEIYHNGPNLTYDVYSNGSQEASHTYTRSATFSNWDDSQPANVTLRSRNSEGISEGSSWLWVPAMEDVEKRRATHLRYQHNNKSSTTLTWNKPEDNDLLLGYTIYWCSASDTLGQFCHDGVATNNISVDGKELQEYVFGSSMALQDIALRPNYSDHVSGGMSLRLVAVENKESEAFSLRKARILEGIGALLVLGLVILSAKKLKKMSEINVVLPEMGHWGSTEPKSQPEEPAPRMGVPRITNPNYDPSVTIVSIELDTFPTEEDQQKKEPVKQVQEESFTEVVVAQAEPESSSYVCMDGGNRNGKPPSPLINPNCNGYVMASPAGTNPNSNGYVDTPPRLIPNSEGYINPPPPRLNPNNNGYVVAPPPRITPNSNGYVMAPPPRVIPITDDYVNPPPPRLIPNSDGYINPPPPQR